MTRKLLGGTDDAWLEDHLASLRRQIDRLQRTAARAGTGKRATERVATANAEAEKLERRVARLARVQHQRAARKEKAADRMGQAAERAHKAAEKTRQHAKRLARSKDPRERAELVVNAAAELPVELALAAGEEILRQ